MFIQILLKLHKTYAYTPKDEERWIWKGHVILCYEFTYQNDTTYIKIPMMWLSPEVFNKDAAYQHVFRILQITANITQGIHSEWIIKFLAVMKFCQGKKSMTTLTIFIIVKSLLQVNYLRIINSLCRFKNETNNIFKDLSKSLNGNLFPTCAISKINTTWKGIRGILGTKKYGSSTGG